MFGYHGKILHIDLTRCATRLEQPDEHFYINHLNQGVNNDDRPARNQACPNLNPLFSGS